MVSEDLIDETILKLAHKAGVGKLIAPMEVAVAIVGKNEILNIENSTTFGQQLDCACPHCQHD